MAATPVTVEIVRNGDVVAARRCDTPVCDVDAPVQIVDPNTFVYARVAQAGDAHAWSSPVWVRGACASGTSCLKSRLVAGGDDDDGGDCLARWLLPAAGTRLSRGRPSRLTCRDGDAACDADAESGTCTFRLGLCFAVADPSGAACASSELDGFEVLSPAEPPPASGDPTALENRQTLEAMFRAATTAADKPNCTPLSALRIPVGERKLEIRALAGSRHDTDAIVLECAPARSDPVRRLPRLRLSTLGAAF